MRLYFLRHGIAADARMGQPDAARPLTAEGIAKTEQLAAQLPNFGVTPHTIYTSPKVRAKHTAEIVNDVLQVPLVEDPRIANGFHVGVVQLIVQQHTPSDDLLFVGHEPTFSHTVSHLIGGGQIRVKKGSLIRVDTYGGTPLHGSLVWLLPPRLLS